MAANNKKEINWLKLDFDAISERLEQNVKDATEAGKAASENISDEEKAELTDKFEKSLTDMEFFFRIFVPNIGKDVGLKRKMTEILHGENTDVEIDWDTFDLDAVKDKLRDASAASERLRYACTDDCPDEEVETAQDDFLTALDNYRFFMREFDPYLRPRVEAMKGMTEILQRLNPKEPINWLELDDENIKTRLSNRLSAVSAKIQEFEETHNVDAEDIPEGAMELGQEYEEASGDYMFFAMHFMPLFKNDSVVKRKMTEILRERMPDLIPQ